MKDLLRDSLVWDNHGCMPLRADDIEFLPQLKRYKDAGVDVATLNIAYDAVRYFEDIKISKSKRGN